MKTKELAFLTAISILVLTIAFRGFLEDRNNFELSFEEIGRECFKLEEDSFEICNPLYYMPNGTIACACIKSLFLVNCERGYEDMCKFKIDYITSEKIKGDFK